MAGNGKAGASASDGDGNEGSGVGDSEMGMPSEIGRTFSIGEKGESLGSILEFENMPV
jgi:hypothetical protein